jgi:glycosyltransferase 2 family protein
VSSVAQSKWKNLLRWLPGVLISAIALYALLRFIHIQDFQQAFRTASWQFVVIEFFALIISMFIRGKAWQTILGNHVTWKQAFFGISEGYFLNNIFPLRAGEIARSIFVGKSSGLGTFHVLSTIVIERAFDIEFAAILVLTTLPLVVGLAWVKTIAMIALVLVILGMFGLFLIAQNRKKVSAWVMKIAGNHKFIEKHIAPQISKLMDGLSTLTDPRQFFLSFFWIGLTWFVWILIYDYMVWQIIPGAPLWNGAFVGSILALGVAIPSAPAALGVYEASMVAAVVIIGGAESIALVYAILLHVLQFSTSMIFGLWGLIRDGQKLSTLMTDLSINQNSDQVQEAEIKEQK